MQVNIQRSINLRRDIYDKGIAYLEAAKQENFSRETIEVWYNEFCRMGWTEEDFRRAVMSVLKNPTYGKIKFDDFLHSEDLFTMEYVRLYTDKMIENRKKHFITTNEHLVGDELEKELEREGLLNVHSSYWRKREIMLGTIQKRIEKRTKVVEHYIRHCDNKTRDRILDIAIAKKVIVKDKFVDLILPMCAPMLLDEVESMILEMPL